MNVRLLTTASEKLKGVIGKDKLESDEIFVFTDITPHTGFHMQGVKFPIDIAFLDKDYGILDIQTMEPETGTAKAPDGTVLAVEASKDYFKTNNIKKGGFWIALYNKIG